MTSSKLFTACLYENEWYVLGMFMKFSIKGLCSTWSTMANAMAPWWHITVPMSYPYIQTQQPTSLWIHAAWCVHFMLKTIEKIAFLWHDNTFHLGVCILQGVLKTIEKIAFLWHDNTFHCTTCHLSRPCLVPHIHFLAVFCCSHAFRQVNDWLL
jgi:hypothetical protein